MLILKKGQKWGKSQYFNAFYMLYVFFFQLICDMYIDLSCDFAVFVAKPSRDLVYADFLLKQQWRMCMPQGMRSNFMIQIFFWVFFQMFRVYSYSYSISFLVLKQGIISCDKSPH